MRGPFELMRKTAGLWLQLRCDWWWLYVWFRTGRYRRPEDIDAGIWNAH